MVIAAGVFKAKCLGLMERVHRTREEITISKHGKPVARLVPCDDGKAPTSRFGSMKGSVLYEGDIVAPIGEVWDADK